MWNVIGAAILLVVLVIGYVILKYRRQAKKEIISIVALQRTPRGLTEADVRGACRRAIGADAIVQTIAAPGKARLFLVVHESIPPIGVIDSSERYDSDGKGNIEQSHIGYEHEDVRRALETHTAWLSIDAMGITSDQLGLDGLKSIQHELGKLLSELLDDNSILLYETVGGRFGRCDSAAADALRRGDLSAIFGDDEMQEPVFEIGTEDEQINAAIKVAQLRLPEFCRKVSSGKCTNAIVKGALRTSEGNREFIWLSVVDLTPSGFRARIENNPVDEAIPRKGSVIELDMADVVDWAYLDESGNRQGGFVDQILLKRAESR